MAKNEKKKMGRLTKKDVQAFLGNLFREAPDEDFSLRELYAILHAKTHPSKMIVIDVVDDMLEAGFLENVGRGVYRLSSRLSEEDEEDTLIGKQFVGRLDVSKNYAFLVTESRELRTDIFIPPTQLKGAKNNDKCVVEIVEWPARSRNPIGKIIDVLGQQGDNDVEMHAILAEYGLPYKYPESVERAADLIDPGITPEEIGRREDFREVLTFTIDPRDAKDFDDALSFREMPDGMYEVGVHIADVSHYVHEGDIIDREAQKRATSVYLVDRTIPMLPERLCNFICSLRPDEEKLCYSVIFTLDKEAKIHKWHLAHTVIRSNRRMTYEEAQEILENKEVTGDVETAVVQLWKLAEQLRKRRFQSGAIGFDRPEVRFEIDEEGRPISTYVVEDNESHWLIEEFMLLANRSVAESVAQNHIGTSNTGGKDAKKGTPKVLPYRIHDEPSPDKLGNLGAFTAKLGYKVKTEGKKSEVSKSLNALLKSVKGQKEENVVETMVLRAMAKARYSIHNIGHYGLMFQHYTHFTSPIRRYPDTMVHRLLTRYMEGGRSGSATKYENLCEHCSDMEQLAATAERASIKYKQVEFMGEHIGQEFEGTVSGVTEYGVYVEVDDTHCEGMVPLRQFTDDYYEYDDKTFSLWGRRTHRRIQIGDKMRVKVKRANLEKRQLDFEVVEG